MRHLLFLCICIFLFVSSSCSDLLGNEELQEEIVKKANEKGFNVQVDGPSIINGKNRPIYVVDGEVLKIERILNKLDPKNIKNIDVLKDSEAKKYGPKGVKNGVVLITTKNKAKN